MIGVSLSFDWFFDGTDLESMLLFLRAQEVHSVELRAVRAHHTPEQVLTAANMLWDQGFSVTVHGAVRSADSAVQDVFHPLEAMLGALRQERLTVTVHPIAGDVIAMLTALSDHILEQGYPVTVALENNRLLPDGTEGDSAALVLEAVTAVNRDNVGICFDMGHFTYYVKKNCPDTPELLPPPEFFRKVVHTHIHALNGLQTHFPLGSFDLPLKAIMDKLCYGYFGVYNLELDFPRFQTLCSPMDALAQSVPFLRASLQHCAKLYQTVRTSFDNAFRSALECWNAPPVGTTFALIHCTAYLFCTNGHKWGMDIAFRNAWHLAKTPAQAADLLQDMEFMVISHGHGDHFEADTIRLLAKNKTLFVVPEFLKEEILAMGVSEEKLVPATAGQALQLCGVTLLPFESPHFRPNGAGIREYGYYVTAPDCPSMVFPVDIRDYTKVPDVPQADYCFANVWLQDNSADPESWEPVMPDWAGFMLRMSNRNLLLTHLYENGRTDDTMWRAEHAQALAETVRRICPETHVHIPEWGECIRL